jgi:hypothetical protein
MSKKRILRIVGGWSSVTVIVLGMSYCSEATKHRFEDARPRTPAVSRERASLAPNDIGAFSPSFLVLAGNNRVDHRAARPSGGRSFLHDDIGLR